MADADGSGLIKRLEWLTTVRWFFIALIVIAAIAAEYVFKITFFKTAVYSVAVFIGIYNLAFRFFISQINRENAPAVVSEKARRLILSQSLLDIVSLTVIIHFTGGIENPFIFYFIFHAIMTGIILSKKEGYIQACVISFLAGGVFLLEYFAVIAHYPLTGFIDANLYNNPLYAAALSFAFISTIFGAAYFTLSITERLAAKEKELQQANSRLLEKDRLKDEYVKMVSHDLKSPLASIQSLLETVIGGYAGSVDKKAEEAILRACKKTEFLHHYTKDLLDLSRIRAAENLKLSRFRLKDVIDQSIELALPKKEDKDIKLSLDISEQLPDTEADREQIIYVFLNLIANAFKYTPAGGTVDIKASQHGDSIDIEIKDTGIGIPKQDAPHIFEEFFRAGNVAGTTKEGTGLGLALTKYVIERHGGTINFESEEGKGTSFRFRLPVRGANTPKL